MSVHPSPQPLHQCRGPWVPGGQVHRGGTWGTGVEPGVSLRDEWELGHFLPVPTLTLPAPRNPRQLHLLELAHHGDSLHTPWAVCPGQPGF